MKRILQGLILSLCCFLSACSNAERTQKNVANNVLPLNNALADVLAVYALMSSNVYLDSKRTYFPIEKLGWEKVDVDRTPINEIKNSYSNSLTNLQFDIWEHKKTNKTIFAFKGTDEKSDWLTNMSIGISIAYKSAKKKVKNYVRENPEREVTLTGHSLGGGIALSVSLWEGVPAYVFNSSPRVFDGMADNKKKATRIATFQKGDILDFVRKKHPKFVATIPPEDTIRTDFDMPGKGIPSVRNHRMDYLAEGILRCTSDDTKWGNFKNSLKEKLNCYL